MSQQERNEKDKALYGHILPSPDPGFCSHCRKAIIQGLHNVVLINEKPEVVLGLDGKALGSKAAPSKKPRAYFHAHCFQEIADERKIPGRVECKYCGMLSLAKTLADGSPNRCQCSCHQGKTYCSMLLV